MEKPQLNQEKNKPPLERMNEIMSNRKLPISKRLEEIEEQMIHVESPKLEDLFTVAIKSEKNKSSKPDYESNLDKTEMSALYKLLEIMEKSPDPKKWSKEIKTISRSEGKEMIDLIEHKIIVLGAQINPKGLKQEIQDYRKKDIKDEINKLNNLHTRLELFVKLLH